MNDSGYLEQKRIQLLLLDEDFKQLTALLAFTSLQWIERYYQEGQFELVILRDNVLDSSGNLIAAGIGTVFDKLSQHVLNTTYVYRNDKKTTGIVDWRQSEIRGNRIVVRGRFLESKLQDRSIVQTQTYSGTAETVCRQIVNNNAINPADPARKIQNLILGPVNSVGTNISMQRTLRTVYDVVNEILMPQELSFRVVYDIVSQKMAFEVYQGKDRTQGQSVNTPCVFSTGLKNVINEIYTESKDNKNFAHVAGAGEGDDRVFVEVDMTNGSPRRELSVDARDIQPTDTILVTSQAYKDLLINRGREKLAEWNITDSVECEIDTNNAMFFELGDKCTYVSTKYGVLAEGRITEIWESFENNNHKKNIILGKNTLTIVQKIKRGVV